MKGCGEIDNRRSLSDSRERLECEHMIRGRTCRNDFHCCGKFLFLLCDRKSARDDNHRKLPVGTPDIGCFVVVLLSQSHFRKSIQKSKAVLVLLFIFDSLTLWFICQKSLLCRHIFICAAQPELKSNRSAGLRSIEVETVHIRFWGWIIKRGSASGKAFSRNYSLTARGLADSNRNTIEWEITSFIYTNLKCYYLISRRWWGGKKKVWVLLDARQGMLAQTFSSFSADFSPLLTMYPGGRETEESRIRIINNYCLFIPLFPFLLRSNFKSLVSHLSPFTTLSRW